MGRLKYMPQSYKNIKIAYPNEGVIRTAQMSDTIAPVDSVQAGVNIVFDQIGSWKTRLGLTSFATALGGAIISLGRYAQNSGSVRRLLAQVGTVINSWNGSTWTNVRTLSSSNKCRYSEFLNLLYTVNGSGAGGDPIKTFNGTSYGTTNVAYLPKGDYVQAGYEGRIWVADAILDRLYYSDIVSVNGVITTTLFILYTPGSGVFQVGDIITGGTSGATARVNVVDDIANRLEASPLSGTFVNGETITGSLSGATGTVTQATCAYIEKISPQDGESITALYRVPRALLVFKQNHIYRVYSATNIDPYPAYNVGTFSAESIIEAKDGLYFHHPSGFYRFQYDGQPQEISRRIIDYVRAIPRSNYENIVGAYDGFDNVTWSIGPVTVEGVTYNNCQVRYTISTQVWTTYDLSSGFTPKSMINYDSGNVIAQIIGLTNGGVYQSELGYTDGTEEIYFEMITRWLSVKEIWGAQKEMSGFILNSTNGAGIAMQYQIDKDQPNEWHDLGKAGQEYSSLFPNEDTLDFDRIRLRVHGTTKGAPIICDGIEVQTLVDKGFAKN